MERVLFLTAKAQRQIEKKKDERRSYLRLSFIPRCEPLNPKRS
jgi:hypothetical protein